MEAIDLFDHPELMPDEVVAVLEKYSEQEVETYEACERLQKELELIGYTIEYGLDACPYNLRKIEQQNN